MNHPSPAPSRREWTGVLLILALFIVSNVLVGTLTPTVYMDEPEHCDPAANLYFGAGFTSTAWAQSRTAFWSGYVPLYSGILWAFFKLAGFGFFQARFVNTLLTACAGLLVWSALARTSLVRTPANRLLGLALILSGSISTLTFRTIRPDATMFLVCAVVFYAGSFATGGGARYLLAGGFSLLLPFAGVSLLPYVGMLLFLNFVIYRWANLRLLIAIGCGMTLGVVALLLFYRHFSALPAFLHFLLPSTIIGGTSAGGTSFLRAKIFGDSLGSINVITSFFGNPLEFRSHGTMFDYSAALLFAAVLLLSLTAWRAVPAARRFMVFIVAATLLVPLVMFFAGHYPSYYRWMTYIPLAIAVPRLLEIHRAAGLPVRPRGVVLAIAGLSLMLGIPARSLAIAPVWRSRSTAPLEQVAKAVVRDNDEVIGDYKAYFALKPRCKLLYTFGMNAYGDFSQITDLPTNDISLLCLLPEDVDSVTNAIGGAWTKVPLDNVPGADALTKTPRYAVEFYRRAGAK